MKRLLILLSFFCITWIACVAQAAEYNAFQYYYQGQYDKAHPKLLELAEKKNSQALYFLANMNLFGYGMQKNNENGFKYMQQSANAKNLQAQMYLGAYYLHHEKDLKQALVWLKKAANQGNPNAQMFTALCYQYGLGTKKNLNTAKKYIILAAKNDMPMAQFLLAKLFLKSRHYRDKMMGRIWMAKAARNYYPDAALTYGIMLYTGKNIKTNQAEGISWIERAIHLGNKNAQTVLSDLQNTGELNDNDLDSKPAIFAEENIKPWEIMIALLKKANVNIANPKRMLAKGDAQTEMPVLQSLSKNTIIKPEFKFLEPNDLPIYDILAQVSRQDYQKQSQKLHIYTYSYVLPNENITYPEAFKELTRLANHGHTHAMFDLALLYASGKGIEQNMQKAFSLLMKAAKLNYLKAEYMVGIYYLKGLGVEKNTHMAVYWLRKSALHGNAMAQLLLGNIYEYGLDINSQQPIKKDITRARAMYNLAAQTGMPAAQSKLAQMYASGIFNPTNNHKTQMNQLKIAYQLFTKAAQSDIEKAKVYLAYFYAAKNDSQEKHNYAYDIASKFAGENDQAAELLRAILYDRGIGVQKNPRAALGIYQTLAKNNNVIANFMLGSHYYLHNHNDKRAEEYLAKAAEQGIGYAQYNLAIIAKNNHQLHHEFLTLLNKAIENGYSNAHLLLADYYLVNENDQPAMQKAAHIYQQLAKKQNPLAELRLGYIYQQGIYFTKNIKKALHWYHQSAKNNNKIAQYQLGEIYFLGQGVKRNVNLALNYYMKSAKQQFAPAMAAVGYIKAVDQFDYQNAKKWYQKAAKLNNKKAKENLKILASLESRHL